MLTLTRRIGEHIVIGSSITVTVLSVSRGRARLGISAPRELPVHRGEVVERIAAENQRALGSGHSVVPEADLDAATIHFPDGIFGMADHTEFLFCDVGDNATFRALVSRKDPGIEIIVVEAIAVWEEFPVAEAQKAAGMAGEEVAVAAVVTMPADGSEPSVNLLAPIVISLADRRGVQVILDKSGLGVRHSIAVQVSETPSAYPPVETK